MPLFGPLRSSLEAVHASLSIPQPACPDVGSQAEATADVARPSSDDARRVRSVACLVTAQVTPNPPTGPSWGQWVLGVGLAFVLALIVFLISKL
jgi:hypothetical protein